MGTNANAAAPVNATGQLAQTLSGFDTRPVIDAQESNLGDYLNQPVHDITSRLGAPGLPQPAPPPDPTDPNAAAGSNAAGSAIPGMLTGLLTQMIQPVTEALGMLGSGSFGDLDPTQLLSGISQTAASAVQPVQQAMSGLDGAWQGAAASAATATTDAALTNGTQVANQSSALATSLATATAGVQQANAQLVAIMNQFTATIAAIGPNIIFPWGMAEAIAAANQAVTQAATVMTQLQGTLAAEEANVTAIGTPISVTQAPQTGASLAGAVAPGAASASPLAANFAVAPAAAAGAPLGAAVAPAASAPVSSFAPALMQAVAMPAMSGVSAATGALQDMGGAGAGTPAGATAPGGPVTNAVAGAAGKGGFGGGGGGALGGIPLETIESRVAAPAAIPAADTAPPMTGDAAAPPAMGAGSPMGGYPMGLGSRAGAGKTHSAAAFLHTAAQGDEIVGDLGSVAPPVFGEADSATSPDIDLRI